MKSKKLFYLILGLSLIASLLIIWRLFFYSKPLSEPVVVISPTPKPTQVISPLPSSVSQEKGESEKEIINSLKVKFPLISYVPFENENFRIDYQAPLVLKVTIKTGDKTKIETMVINWIKSKGVDPATHKINYFTPEPSPAL